MKKEISLNDSNYFELFIGGRVLKKKYSTLKVKYQFIVQTYSVLLDFLKQTGEETIR
jgi:hypothetical protein